MGMVLRGERAEARTRSVHDGEITYQRVFVVETDNDRIGPHAVSFCPGLPFLGYPYSTVNEFDALALCIGRDAKPVGRHRRLWEVTTQYSSKHGDPEQQNSEEQQLELEPPEVSLDFVSRTRVAEGPTALVDDSGDEIANPFGGITNAAGDPFDPPPEEEVDEPILTITRNELSANWETWRGYTNSVNNDAFMGANPRQVRMKISARKAYKNALRYYRVSYILEFQEATWDLQLLNIGPKFYEADGQGGISKKAFVTADDPPQRRLGLLTADGFPTDQPTFRRFKRKKERAFGTLQLQEALHA